MEQTNVGKGTAEKTAGGFNIMVTQDTYPLFDILRTTIFKKTITHSWYLPLMKMSSCLFYPTKSLAESVFMETIEKDLSNNNENNLLVLNGWSLWPKHRGFVNRGFCKSLGLIILGPDLIQRAFTWHPLHASHGTIEIPWHDLTRWNLTSWSHRSLSYTSAAALVS